LFVCPYDKASSFITVTANNYYLKINY